MSAIAGLSLLASCSFAADTIITPSRTFTVSRSATTSTLTVQPQIQPIRPVNRNISENEWVPSYAPDAPNNLVPGGIRNVSRMSAPKITFTGPGFTGFFPPDCDMAVGPNHVVAVVNTRIAFFNKSNGQKTFEQDMDNNGFFSGAGGASEVYSDPKVFYDKTSGRWFVFIIEVNGLSGGTQKSRVLTAVSDDNNPNGNWFKYSIDTLVTQSGNSYWLDYPTVGMNKDAIAIGGNNFGFSSGFIGTLFVVKKASLLSGGTATVNSFTDGNIFTIQPARSFDANNDKIYGLQSGNGSTIRVWAVNNVNTTPTLVGTTVNVPSYQTSGPAPSAGGNQLDTLGSRMFNCMYGNGKVVASHTVRPQGGGANRVRWYSVNVGNWPTSGQPTLQQSGEVTGQAGSDSHMPAIAINSLDDITLIYNQSSSSLGADLMRTGRAASDPAGTMGTPVKIKGSNGTYPWGRWGDYFGCAVDPADNATFWGFGMTINGQGVWETTVTSWTVSTGGGAGGLAVDASSISTIQGSYIVGDESSVQTINNVFYQMASAQSTQLGQVASAQVDFVVPTDTSALKAKVVGTINAAGGTLTVYAWDWTASAWVLAGSQPTKTSGSVAQTINFPAASFARFLGNGGAVRMMVRAHNPKRPFSNVPPAPFTFRVDQCQALVTQG